MTCVGTRWQQTDAPRGDDYDARWTRLADAGESIHGEADLVDSLLDDVWGRRVLDAGCGTGRVAVELARRGYQVVGIDADHLMLEAARAKAPEISWLAGDLSELGSLLTDTFDLILLAGNVMIFLEPGTEARVVEEVAEHLAPGGVLVAGFSVSPDRLPLDVYDALARRRGLKLLHRWSTWGRQPYAGGDYAVSVHGRSVAVSGNPSA